MPAAVACILLVLFLADPARADETRTLVVGGTKRVFIVHRPSPPRSGALPLMISLHGGGGTAAGDVGFTQFDGLADREGFVVAYPDSIGRHWNNGQRPDEVDDVAFVAAVVDALVAGGGIDRHRVYASGISSGAIMSFHLACRIPNAIAAIAAVAGSLATSDAPGCASGPPVAVAMLNGTADPLVPYGGGTVIGPFGGSVLGVEATLAFFAKRNGCGGSWTTSRIGNTVDHVVAACPPQTGAELYRLLGGGHTWPGGIQYLPVRFIGTVNRDINGTQTIWSFVSRFTR
ncbi:MAG: esterase [Candidatus Eremiobacteraeota bacterium]|nr:esterase [Candidatus Eremiobacteraeota bacterium]